MERLEGHDLEAEIRDNGAMNVDRMTRLFLPVLDALAQAHAKGVVHKDLKPSNLFIMHAGTAEERMVVLDFGIARIMDARTQYTQVGTFAGTPAYLAPEYIRDQTVTPTVDVYQMGLIIIEVLIGRPVVSANSAIAYLMKHVQGEHDVPSELRASKLGALLVKAIEVDPKLRFQDASGFRDALGAWSAARTPKAATTLQHLPQPMMTAAPVAGVPTAPANRPRPVAPKKKSGFGTVILLFLLFGFFSMFGLFMLIILVSLAE
jgi:serine/threonine-protein kinase